MNRLSFLLPPACYLEIGQDYVKAQGAAAALELEIERQANGRLTPGSKEKLLLALQGFLKRKAWQPRVRVTCAIPARGVTLRRLTLPASSKENLVKLLKLQIEAEFPLPPEELAWGYRLVSELAPKFPGLSNIPGKEGQQEVLVMAVKKEVIEEYAEILSACGTTSVFTLAALARSRLCPPQPGGYGMLDIGRTQSELTAFADGIPVSVRVLPWGTSVITRALQTGLALPAEDAQRLASTLEAGTPEAGERMDGIVESALQPLAASLNGSLSKLFLTGASGAPAALAPRLARQAGNGLDCQPLAAADRRGGSAALLGLEQDPGSSSLLLLQAKTTNGTPRLPQAIAWDTAKPVAALLLALLCLPYAEAFLLKPFLSHKLNALKAHKAQLLAIDRELGFLQYLRQNQSPYLDALYLLSKAAPPGAHIDSLSMNRNGDLTLRLSVREPTQAVDFRSKLVNSGFFSNVALEEQVPAPDHQKLNLRFSAQWKAAGAREGLALGPSADEIERARTNKSQPMGPPMMMPMPPPMGISDVPGAQPEVPTGKGSPAPGPRRNPARPRDANNPGSAGTEGGPK